jgi:endonuclease YncB( thermonuclease family)
MRFVVLILLTAFALTVAHAETISGFVVAIADGDTLSVLDAGNQQHKIRLAGIDAPEKKQPFGQRSKDNLAALTFNKLVTIEWNKRDRYQRIIGKVLVNGQDANLEQLKAGMAWWYHRYANEQAAPDRIAYQEAEQNASEFRLGLWRDPQPIPPWDWRKGAREASLTSH